MPKIENILIEATLERSITTEEERKELHDMLEYLTTNPDWNNDDAPQAAVMTRCGCHHKITPQPIYG